MSHSVNEHLHLLHFAGFVVETVGKSLRHFVQVGTYPTKEFFATLDGYSYHRRLLGLKFELRLEDP